MPSFALLAVPYYGVRNTGLTAVGDAAQLVPSTGGTGQISATTSTSYGAGTNYGSTGTKASQRFRVPLSFPYANVRSGRVRAQWQIVTQASAGAPQGRLNYHWEKNGAAISGASTVNGGAQNLGAAAGTQYTDIVSVPLPSGVTFDAGDTLDLVIGFEVTTAVAGTGEVQLNHDPAVAAQRIIVDFDQNN